LAPTETIEYFHGRKVWMVQADTIPAQIRPYQATVSSQIVAPRTMFLPTPEPLTKF